jgi:hypothetical protein
MKRNSSDIEPSSPISSQSVDFKPDISPPPTSKIKTSRTKSPSTQSPKKKAKKESSGSSTGGGRNGEWTPEKKAIFMDRVIATGYRGLDLGELAEEVCSSMYVHPWDSDSTDNVVGNGEKSTQEPVGSG